MGRLLRHTGPGLWVAVTLPALWLVLGLVTSQDLYLHLAQATVLTALVGLAAWNLAPC